MANPAREWNASSSYVPLSETTDGPSRSTTPPPTARRLLIRLPDLSAVVANPSAAGQSVVAGLSEAAAEATPPISNSISPAANEYDFSITTAAAANHVQRVKLHAALASMLLAYLSHLARHPRTLAAGLLVAVTQFFVLMLVNGRLTISEPTPAGAAATQNQVAGGDWLPPALEPTAPEAPKWTAVTTADHDAPSASPVSDADPASLPSAAPAMETPASEAPAIEPAITPAAPATDSLPSASKSTTQPLTIEQANALMASRPKPPGATTAIPTHTPGVARLRGQIAPHGYLREPLTSAAQGTQQ
jgi:hypothetical protein